MTKKYKKYNCVREFYFCVRDCKKTKKIVKIIFFCKIKKNVDFIS